MKLSIITPCSRPLNLPTLYWSILNMKTNDVEWIIIYDGSEIDNRILQYQENVNIRLFNLKRSEGDSMGAMLRNVGIKNAYGDYLYFLDDDNLVHPKLYDRICSYGKDGKILVFNQFDTKFQRRINKLDINCVRNGVLDTAQFVVPRKYNTRWTSEQKRFEEIPYFRNLINEAGENEILFIDRIYSYRNYLRRYEIK